jgi:hypothetical protein
MGWVVNSTPRPLTIIGYTINVYNSNQLKVKDDRRYNRKNNMSYTLLKWLELLKLLKLVLPSRLI